VHDIIVDLAIDLFVVVSWPHDSAESPSVITATPHHVTSSNVLDREPLQPA